MKSECVWLALRTATLACVATLAGCGASGPELAENVTGRVTLNDAPLADASVQFVSDTDGISAGRTDADGRFTLYYGEQAGAPFGKHTVRISKFDGEAGDEIVPPKFNSNSDLSADVTADGANDFTFDLKR